MRDRFFRNAALVLGLLIIPSGAFQAYRSWPLDQQDLAFLMTQALMGVVFLSFGLGFISNSNAKPLKPIRDEPSLGD